MTSHKASAPPEHDDLDKIEAAPPTWEEVMAEKTAAVGEPKEEPPKKRFFHHFTLSSKKDKNSKISADFIINEAKGNETAKTEEERVDQNEGVAIVQERSIVACFRKFVMGLKRISALTLVTFDMILWACGIGILVLGCFIHEEKNELLRDLVIYKNEFRKLCQVLIATAIIYIALAVPFGLFGVLRRKRRLLKVHNIWLLLNLVAEGIVLYMIFRYLDDTPKYLEKYNASFKGVFNVTECIAEKGLGQCCCPYNTNNKTITLAKEKCWKYDPEMKMGNITDLSERDVARKIKAYYKKCTDGGHDLFYRFQHYVTKASSFLRSFMIIQLTALCFGVIQSKVIRSGEPPCKKRKKRRRPPKNKLEKIWRKSTELCCRRLLYCLFALLFVLGVIVFNLWVHNFQIKVGGFQVPIETFINSVWNEINKAW